MDRKATTATLLEDMALAGDVRISLEKAPDVHFPHGYKVFVRVGERSYFGGTLEDALDQYAFLTNIELHDLCGTYGSMHGWERGVPERGVKDSVVVFENRIVHHDGLYKFRATVTAVEESVVLEVYKSGLSEWVYIGTIKCANMYEANKEVFRAMHGDVLDKMLAKAVKDKNAEGGD